MSWTLLWGAPVPSKVRVFAWRLSKTSIPTGAVRHHRSMADSAECSICHAANNTWRHSLFNCRMARCVWALADEELTETIISNRTDDAKLWMLWLVDTLPSAELARLLDTMWAIWWARCRAIHDNQYQSPLSTHVFINNFLAELEMIPEKKAKPKGLNANSRDLHVNAGDLHANTGNTNEGAQPNLWIPPATHEVKMNVDGGFSKIGDQAASAVVCRDKRVMFLGASAIIHDGLLDPAVLEAQACREALSLAMDLHVQSICVASDCLEVVTNIEAGVPCQYFSILQEIKHQRRSFHDVNFIYESRKHNGEDHALAKATASLS